jgi:formate hydrogenlyase subunit 3/multisubunit Na+/H+ antiporter MnhD subunit
MIPLAGSAAALAEEFFPRLRVRLGRWASLAALGVLFWALGSVFPLVRGGNVLFYNLGAWPASLRITLMLDGLTWLCGAAALVVSFAVLLYVFADSSYGGAFYFFFLVMVSSIFGLILAEDVFTMFVFMEILGFSSYILIAYQKKPQALVAGLGYMLSSSVGILFFL